MVSLLDALYLVLLNCHFALPAASCTGRAREALLPAHEQPLLPKHLERCCTRFP